MIKKLQLLGLFLLAIATAHAQTVTGRVTSASDGSPVPGVSVIIKGTTNGTATDGEGKYSLSVADPSGATLVFSFIGFQTKEVAVQGQTTIDVLMDEDVQSLSEVVVTAFGLEKEKKALGYSVTQLNGDKFTESRAVNVGNALTGKIAGVVVTPPASGAAGSTRVVIRGGASLTGSNQPLYVINGMPMSSGNLGNAGMWGGNDAGDGLTAINPDDIESISVLKGNAASALYGARASNGVILITTKSGKGQKGLGVTYNANVTFDRAQDFTEYQGKYGSGRDGAVAVDATAARDLVGFHRWGKKFDGSSVIQFDGVSRPYKNLGQGINDFYRTGLTLNNSVAITGGNESTNYRVGFSTLKNNDIMPNAGYSRKVANININSKVKKLTIDLAAQYTNQKAENRPRLSDTPGNANFAAGFQPASLPFSAVQGVDNHGAAADGNELRYQGNVFVTNPYWAAYNFFREDITNRLIGKVSLKYDILPWLSVTGRYGTDFFFRDDESYTGYGTAFKPRGDYSVGTRFFREDNLDIMLTANKQFGEFSVDAMVGGNRMRQKEKSTSGGGNDLVVPFLHTVKNVAAASYGYDFYELGVNSMFASASLSFRNYIFLNLTGRQDAFSVLSRDENKVFYPSAGVSFVLSEAIELPSLFTFAKFRASVGQTGGGEVGPYALNLTYGLNGQGHNGGNLGQINNGSIPNQDLKPYKTNEVEVGMDVRLLNNKLGLDFAYYNRKTNDEIAGLAISPTSGFGSTLLNVMDSRNQGFELMITGTPIEQNGLKWDVTLNYAHNFSKVLDLGKDIQGNPVEFMNLNQSRLLQEQIRHYVGQPAGMIAGWKHKEIDGKPVYDANGYPVRSDAFEMIAPGRHPVSAGLANTLTYKNFRLYTLLDMRYGGYLMSGTNYFAYVYGLQEGTVAARTNGVSVSGVDVNGAELSRTITADASSPTTYLIDNYFSRYAQITENIVYNASFIKLRELSLGYTLPKSILSKTPLGSASVSIVGRNLALLWSKVPNIDPESGYSTSGNDQGLEFFAMPVTRSIGFNVTLGF